jgi:hypothetical protein
MNTYIGLLLATCTREYWSENEVLSFYHTYAYLWEGNSQITTDEYISMYIAHDFFPSYSSSDEFSSMNGQFDVRMKYFSIFLSLCWLWRTAVSWKSSNTRVSILSLVIQSSSRVLILDNYANGNRHAILDLGTLKDVTTFTEKQYKNDMKLFWANDFKWCAQWFDSKRLNNYSLALFSSSVHWCKISINCI